MAGAIAALAIIQVGVVLGIHGKSAPSFPTLELQALVAGLTLTGLYLGVMLDERERAAEGLKQSLRLAAAGVMAGAIAHEVNQPLTALTNYGRSAQLLLSAGKTAEIGFVMQRILAEAQRASEVVRRLRDFFREGRTRLEPLAVAELLESARKIGAAVTGGRDISLSLRQEDGLPELLVDRLQMELVLRNLLANAVEAIEGQGLPGRVEVLARREDPHHVAIVVSDSGPGVPAGQAERVFEPFVSGKPTGMGLGLAVSRAIAEAHGGSLDTRFADHGEFRLVLRVVGAHA
jgi:C4-dicarboxylate-specific signal transduction histidine kinase